MARVGDLAAFIEDLDDDEEVMLVAPGPGVFTEWINFLKVTESEDVGEEEDYSEVDTADTKGTDESPQGEGDLGLPAPLEQGSRDISNQMIEGGSQQIQQ